MRASRRPRSALVALALALAATAFGGTTTLGADLAAEAAAAAETPAPDGPTDVLPAGGSWRVTLLTGEVVDVRSDDEGRVDVVAGESPGPVRSVREPDGDVYVVPVAVTSLVDRVLDRELFNVTGLVRQGYDDGSLDTVPLMVQVTPGAESLPATLAASGDQRPLPSIGAVATRVAKADTKATGELLASVGADTGAGADRAPAGITKVWLDHQVGHLSAPAAPAPVPAPVPVAARAQAPGLDPNLTQVGADDAWAAGFRGDGVTVGVIDGGVDARHPDLAGRVVAEANFSGSPDALDRHGHGTHVAAVAAGSGAGSGGARSGVAPAARIVNAKVLDDDGWGYESEAIAGMEWAAPQADVVNVSLGYMGDSDGRDPLSTAVDELTERHGTLFVVAAGNSGPVSRTVFTPGAAERALTVGAVDATDTVAGFSSRGPLTGSYELKPEIVAPGVDIVAARATDTGMGTPVDDLYTASSGTSMAAPHVAGAAALLAQQHPDWSPDQLKSALIGSTDPVDGDGYAVGAGRLDIGDAVAATVRPDVDVVDLPLAHPRTDPGTARVTWTNTSDQPRTVELAAELEDRQGRPVTAASISPGTLMVPAGATGTAILRVEGAALADGLYSGIVTADPDGGPAADDLRTPVAVHAAAPTVELTIDATPIEGTTGPPSGAVAVFNLDDYGIFGTVLFYENGVTLKVPAGRYSVLGDVSTPDPDAQAIAQVGDPDITLTGDTTIRFDGAVPLRPTVEGVETAPPMHSAAYMTNRPLAGVADPGEERFGYSLAVFSEHPGMSVRLTPMEADPAVFAAGQVYRLQAPPLQAEVGGENLDVAAAGPGTLPPEGEQRLAAVDAGDGHDLSGTRGRLAVVDLPDEPAERAAVTRRAADARTAVLAFTDPDRTHLTLDPTAPEPWADVPTIVAAGGSATRLREAAAAGGRVAVTVTASPYAYDIATPETGTVDPDPVVTRSQQRRLATLHERFHEDADGPGAVEDLRFSTGSVVIAGLATEGPLPRRRTAHVTAGVGWQSAVLGSGYLLGENGPVPADDLYLSLDNGASYRSGNTTTLHWLRRPVHPGPSDRPTAGAAWLAPGTVTRHPSELEVHLSENLDGRGRASGSDPVEATLRLLRDGTEIGTAEGRSARFPVDPEPATYRLEYTQSGTAPYPHRSTSAWTFPSRAPSEPVPFLGERVPMLVVDYGLPLDIRNRPTGRTATFTVRTVNATDQPAVRSLLVWTSVDGATWRPAPAERQGDGVYKVTLPAAAEGTPVSLRVDAQDAAGKRVEQTLYDAYEA